MKHKTSVLCFLLLAVLMFSIMVQEASSQWIIGGIKAAPGQFPYMVFTICPKGACSASIINDNWVISAGHCILCPKDEYQVYAGTLDPIKDLEHVQIRNTVQIIVHPKYEEYTLGPFTYAFNDISLLQVDEPFLWTPYVQPIRLAHSFEQHHSMPEKCIGLGFGDIELQPTSSVELFYMNINELIPCKKIDWILGNHGEKICSRGGAWGVQHLYLGDSGGPLVCEGMQFGVCSMVLPNETTWQLHTSVPHFYQWIKQHVGDI